MPLLRHTVGTIAHNSLGKACYSSLLCACEEQDNLSPHDSSLSYIPRPVVLYWQTKPSGPCYPQNNAGRPCHCSIEQPSLLSLPRDERNHDEDFPRVC